MRRSRLYGAIRAAAALAVAVTVSGCASAALSARASRTRELLPSRAQALVRHCPELACTTAAEVPACAFSENVVEGGDTIRANITCVRDGSATRCVERRSPVGGENQNLQAQRLDYRCSGDPLVCAVTGGNAIWPAPALSAENRAAPDGPISCNPPRSAGPPATPHRIPGPDTA